MSTNIASQNQDSIHVLDYMATTVLLLDQAFHLVYINPAGEMLLSSSARKITGLPLRELVLAPESFFDVLSQSLHTGRPYMEQAITLDLIGGRSVAVDCSVTMTEQFNQQPHILVELVNVNRQVRITREEKLLTQQTATRNLLRGLAHEIKNPLGGLRGAAQLLEREFEKEELKEYTQVIIGEADRLQKLVDRMLGPKVKPNWQTINIHEVVERVIKIVKSTLAPGVTLTRDYDPSIPDLNADPELLIQALLNIVTNAIYAVEDSGTVLIKTRVLRQFTIGQKMHKLVTAISIIDDGNGIPEEIKDTIFYPMVSKRDGGTGLGLSIAQSLVHQHNGLIECEKKEDKTVFTILLPLGLSYD